MLQPKLHTIAEAARQPFTQAPTKQHDSKASVGSQSSTCLAACDACRSLRAYHHYVPILKHSEFDVMPRLQWARQHQTQVRHIVHNANRFALKYATYPARVLYWKYVLTAYRSLFPDMDEYFKQSSATGSQMEYLLKSQLTKILRQHGQNATIGFAAPAGTVTSSSGPGGQMDAVMQEELDNIAVFAGDDAADEQEQQQAVLPEEGGGVDETLLSLTDSDY